MTVFMPSVFVIHTQWSMTKSFIEIIAAVFCGFIQTKVSLGNTVLFSQDEWSLKTVGVLGHVMMNFSLFCIIFVT